MAKNNDAMVDVGYNTMVGVPSVASHHGWLKSAMRSISIAARGSIEGSPALLHGRQFHALQGSSTLR